MAVQFSWMMKRELVHDCDHFNKRSTDIFACFLDNKLLGTITNFAEVEVEASSLRFISFTRLQLGVVV